MNATAQALLGIAKAAGDAILEIYRQDFAVEHKGDESPLTAADLSQEVELLAEADYGLEIVRQ